MSESTAIGMVSESLRALLLDEDLGMQLEPAIPVTLLAPDEPGNDRRINLFLYRVSENPALRNQDWRPNPTNPGQLQPPPLSLSHYYLMTPYAPNDAENGNATAHAILGEAMRVFYENPIIPNTDGVLVDGLVEAREQIKIMLQTLDLEELSSVWTTFNQPMRLSVLYEVSVVQLDQLPASERPLPPRVSQIGPPTVQQPFNPPRVDRIEPISGPVGTVITAHGVNLDGWSASVIVMGRSILDPTLIAGESFTFTLPADLAEGFHSIQINVSNLFRSTFFFEVTP
jgi:hypothetical protein